MAIDPDLKALLDAWAYDPDDCVRVVTLADGREVMQVRLPLGIEQYEIDGRPDGLRPHGAESALDYHLGRSKNAGDSAFELSPDDCVELFNEGVLYYYRYLHLFQINDWRRTLRDTDRNLALFDFVHRHANRYEDKNYLEQWRPYVLRINAISAAMIELADNCHEKALLIVKNAADKIEALPEIDEDTFKFERQRSLDALRDLADQVEKAVPQTELEKLEHQLHDAVSAEHYEQAAQLRDQIRRLQDGKKS
ncbi:MAG TPA: UvrB/UvrC motif-containing protein [Verrucomicrobiae bacterium]|nr:UvrB/UvrC motif-containing protein [Verrucomicrobiae bacterium]